MNGKWQVAVLESVNDQADTLTRLEFHLKSN